MTRTLLLSALCLTVVAAWASDDDADEGGFDELQIRLGVIERIDVSAEKPPIAPAESTDEDIDAILREAEALETDAADE